MLKLIVLASGRGSNLMAIQRAIEHDGLACRILAVLSNKKDAPALGFAAAKGIPALWVDPKVEGGRQVYEKNLLAAIDGFDSDCLVLAGYMLLLGAGFIRAYGKPILNIHPSLLPLFPGLSPHKEALEQGVRISGCTVHFVDAGIDTGPIVAQAAVPVFSSDDEDTLRDRILQAEHKLYPATLALMAQGRVKLEGRRVIII